MDGSSRRTPLVGRDAEMEALLRRLFEAGRGCGGVALVAGEPGIGKTRLLMELAGRARADGWRVLAGAAYDSEGMPPYLPFIEALRAHLRAEPPDRLRAQLGRAAPELARLAPELRDLVPDLPASLPLSPEQERYRLFEAVCDALEGVARAAETGLLLLLDDLHWADAPSLSLLQHLQRRLDGVPALVVAAYRTTELEATRAFVDTLASLARGGAPPPLGLARLDGEETAALVESIAGTPVAVSIVDAIQRASEGNPFFIGEVTRNLQAEGRDLGDPATAMGDWSVPELVRRVIAARLARLGPATVEFLRHGAILGDGFALEVARVASGLDDDQMLAAVEEACAAGVLREERGGYHFAHALIRRTIYDGLSPPRRERLHLRAAEAIEATHAADPDGHLAELAAHYRLGGGGAREKARGFAQRAAAAAAATFAWEDAAAHWRDALDLLLPRRDAERIELLLSLGDALTLAGERPQAVAVFQQAAALGREANAPEWLARAALGLGGSLTVPAMIDKALVRLLREALAALEPGDSVLRARLLARQAMELRFDQVAAQSTALSDDALGMAERVGDRLAFRIALVAKALALMAAEDAEEQAVVTRALAEHARETSDREFRLRISQQLLQAAMQRGDIARVDAVLAESAEIARSLRHQYFLWWSKVYGAMRALLEGEWDACEQLSREAFALGERMQADAVWHCHDEQMAALYWEQGRAAEAVTITTHRAERTAIGRTNVWALPMLLYEAGRRDDAAREFEALVDRGFDGFNRHQLDVGTQSYLAEACHALDDHQRAGLLYEQFLPLAPYVHGAAPSGGVCVGAASRYLGLLATTLRRWDDAIRHFEHALAMHRRMGARPLLAHTQREYAAMLLARRDEGGGMRDEDAERAREMLTQALAVATELGMLRLVEDCQRTLRAADAASSSLIPPPSSLRPSSPDGLSEREVEVLRLLAAGKSNPEIAEALVISVHTVVRHANHIFVKLGVSNRVEAATYAQRHGIA